MCCEGLRCRHVAAGTWEEVTRVGAKIWERAPACIPRQIDRLQRGDYWLVHVAVAIGDDVVEVKVIGGETGTALMWQHMIGGKWRRWRAVRGCSVDTWLLGRGKKSREFVRRYGRQHLYASRGRSIDWREETPGLSTWW
ncbi:hypothetical protein Sjap_009641 [Stephania japonica]|uniref:Uncharacterized protein n=1 Tax=Stephania japonica TaxID=461633 RepID=A0AAP0J836_9MAGN